MDTNTTEAMQIIELVAKELPAHIRDHPSFAAIEKVQGKETADFARALVATAPAQKRGSGFDRVVAIGENDAYKAHTRIDQAVQDEIGRLSTTVETYGIYTQSLAVALRDVLPIVEEAVEETGSLGRDFTEAFKQDNRLLQRAKALLKEVDEDPVLHIRDVTGDDVDAQFDIKFED